MERAAWSVCFGGPVDVAHTRAAIEDMFSETTSAKCNASKTAARRKFLAETVVLVSWVVAVEDSRCLTAIPLISKVQTPDVAQQVLADISEETCCTDSDMNPDQRAEHRAGAIHGGRGSNTRHFVVEFCSFRGEGAIRFFLRQLTYSGCHR